MGEVTVKPVAYVLLGIGFGSALGVGLDRAVLADDLLRALSESHERTRELSGHEDGAAWRNHHAPQMSPRALVKEVCGTLREELLARDVTPDEVRAVEENVAENPRPTEPTPEEQESEEESIALIDSAIAAGGRWGAQEREALRAAALTAGNRRPLIAEHIAQAVNSGKLKPEGMELPF
jgi:hypothetical protein